MKLYEPAPPARKDELANVQDGIAVIVDGDTCPVVVESGMYAYIKNNTHGLAEGLYKNISNSAFPVSGGTADGTVFEADSTGGLNALNASLGTWIDGNSVAGTTVSINIPDGARFVCLMAARDYEVKSVQMIPLDFFRYCSRTQQSPTPQINIYGGTRSYANVGIVNNQLQLTGFASSDTNYINQWYVSFY